MNKDYFTAQELAGLAGMPTSDRRVREKAKRENWLSRPKQTGKGQEYHIGSLPAETQQYFAKQAAEAEQQQALAKAKQQGIQAASGLALQAMTNNKITLQRRQEVMAKIAHLEEPQRQRAESKIIMLGLWQDFVKNSTESKTRATQQFLLSWSNGLIDLDKDKWITAYISNKLSMQTLYSWEKALIDNPEKIWGNYGKRKGTSKIDQDPALKEFIIACITEYPHISSVQLYKGLEARYDESENNLPSKRSVERWLTNYKAENAAVLAAVNTPDKWKNKYMPAFGTLSVSMVNEKWELDSTPADVMLTDGRYNLLGAIDVYSRRVKLIVSKTSTAVAVSKLLRDCLLDWGVPQTIKTDNGADYVSEQTKTALKVLDIHQDISAPFSPWQKPHIERFFRTFSHGLLELLQGYIGHNVAERAEIEDRKQFSERLFDKGDLIDINMSSEDLQEFANNWIENMYMHDAHNGIQGKTPFQILAESTDQIQTISNERALDILLAPVGERTVQKDGIKIDNFTYIAAELGALVGSRVTIRKDPIDVGTIHVFRNGEFICVAEDARYVGIRRQEIAHQAKQNALAERKELKKQIKQAQNKQKVKDLADEIMEHRMQQNNVSMLPKPSSEYRVEMLDAAAEAASMTRPELPVMAVEPKKPVAMMSPQDTYRKWLRIEERINKGETIDQKTLKWHENYAKTPEFSSMKMMYEDIGFGVEAN